MVLWVPVSLLFHLYNLSLMHTVVSDGNDSLSVEYNEEIQVNFQMFMVLLIKSEHLLVLLDVSEMILLKMTTDSCTKVVIFDL